MVTLAVVQIMVLVVTMEPIPMTGLMVIQMVVMTSTMVAVAMAVTQVPLTQIAIVPSTTCVPSKKNR